MPPQGQWYADARTGGDDGADRALRVTWHPEQGCVVLSTWREGRCTGSARLGPQEAAALVGQLADGLADLTTTQAAASPDATARVLGA